MTHDSQQFARRHCSDTQTLRSAEIPGIKCYDWRSRPNRYLQNTIIVGFRQVK